MILLTIPITATEIDEINVHYILRDNGYDLDSKSYNGWLRIFNNKDILYKYELGHLSRNEIELCIKQLIELKNNKIVGKLK
jgi:glucose-6-phosphate dehydrogenase assembly protein OpcA